MSDLLGWDSLWPQPSALAASSDTLAHPAAPQPLWTLAQIHGFAQCLEGPLSPTPTPTQTVRPSSIVTSSRKAALSHRFPSLQDGSNSSLLWAASILWMSLYYSIYHTASQLFTDISISIIKEMCPAGCPVCVRNHPWYDIKIQFSQHFYVSTVTTDCLTCWITKANTRISQSDGDTRK